jgi:multisite-specific tRNA:(cytosine-C5)-methyltransferase
MENSNFKSKDPELNQIFKEYFKNLLPMNPNEFSEFLKSQTVKLPITCRINKIYNYCEFLECELQSVINKLNLQPARYNWNHLDNIYIFPELDKKKHSELKDLMIRENDLGILRQELVSMIPVSLVDIQEDSIILDMCAAPGNKSVQILELMQERGREKGIIPTGVLISNELDHRRGEKLVHLLQSQPTVNVISTLCPAQEFPIIKEENLRPNIIFCDVPCSGDGTLRKNKGLRKRWKLDYGYQNHPLQIQILENSIRLCKVDGYVVYSTCSINPVENEAVVAYILEKYKNEVELLDLGTRVKNGLKINFSEGLVKWKVAYEWKNKSSKIKKQIEKNSHQSIPNCETSSIPSIQWCYDYSQVKEAKNNPSKYLIKESMFHDIYTKKNHQNNIYFSDPLNLRRCMRFYSHQNNSGCFFVAVFKKKQEIKMDSGESNQSDYVPLNKIENRFKTIKDELEEMMEYLGVDSDFKEKKSELKQQTFLTENLDEKELPKECEENQKNESNQKTENLELFNFDKFVKFKDYTENFEILKKFYNFYSEYDNAQIESLLNEQLFTLRTTSNKILLCSKKLSQMIKVLCNMNLNIMHAGLVCFTKERTNLPGKYRLSHYGGLILEGFIKNQKIELESNKENKDFVINLLKNKKIKFEEIQPEILRNQINEFQMGSLLLIYESVVLTCRKGNNNLSVMIPDIQLNNLSEYVLKYL